MGVGGADIENEILEKKKTKKAKGDRDEKEKYHKRRAMILDAKQR